MSNSAHRNSRKGFSLLLAGCCLTVMIGMFGLTVDLGRIYVVKSEIQAFADAAAMAAALRLDATANGVTSAQTIGTTGPGNNRWNFNSQNIPANNVTVTLGTTKDGPWLAANSVGNGAGYRFVRVNVTAGLPVYFIRIFQGAGATQTVNAVATAGQFAEPNPGKWLDPFSPDALSSTDPTFGYQHQNNTGQNLYTLVWPPKGHRTVKCGATGAWDESTSSGSGDGNGNNPDAYNFFAPGGNGNGNGNGGGNGCVDTWTPETEMCPGDFNIGYAGENSASRDRGYIQLNRDASNGNPGLEAAILGHHYGPNLPALRIGDTIDTIPGQRNSLQLGVSGALLQRVTRDTDSTSTTFAQYEAANNGNGSRLVRVPINQHDVVVGFATFFLPVQPCRLNGWPCCAEFVDNKVLMGGSGAAGERGKSYRVKLF